MDGKGGKERGTGIESGPGGRGGGNRRAKDARRRKFAEGRHVGARARALLLRSSSSRAPEARGGDRTAGDVEGGRRAFAFTDGREIERVRRRTGEEREKG